MKRICFGMVNDPNGEHPECVEHVFYYHNSVVKDALNQIGKVYLVEYENNNPILFYTKLVDKNYKPGETNSQTTLNGYYKNRAMVLRQNTLSISGLSYAISPPANRVSTKSRRCYANKNHSD